jgi:hypothetical protein
MRARERDRALRLLFFTLAWSSFQAFIGMMAAVSARSVAMLGFGAAGLFDACSTGLIMSRLWAEESPSGRSIVEGAGPRPRQLVTLLRFAISVVLVLAAAVVVWQRAHPRPTIAGIAVTVSTLGVTYLLARGKKRSAAGLDRQALAADSHQTKARALIALFALLSVGLNALRGWWWADPLAALIISGALIGEGLDELSAST